MDILKVSSVSKTYGKHKVLSDVSFTISEGEVVGFIGPNGAGKTTTMRIITDLIRPDCGSVEIFGHNVKKEREKALENISAIIENPGLYTYMSGKANLKAIAKLRGVSKEKLEEIIEFVGIGSQINDKVKKYSLGMKQRLGLGLCLLTSPKLLLLDEPTNGLDHDGVLNLRGTFAELKKQGVSIFVSSHNLLEIEKCCDRFIFIDKGVIVADKKNEVMSESKTFKFDYTDPQVIKEIFDASDLTIIYNIRDNTVVFSTEQDKLSEILKLLAVKNIDYKNFAEVTSDIEEDYSEIYSKKE